jgi:tetratricopeptide (TPR) repeat protein
MIVLLCLLSACSRDDRREKSKVNNATSEYSADTIFEEVYKKVQQNPNDIDALYHLADLYDRAAQYPEAVETYQKVVKLKPDMGYSWFKMATAYDRMNRPAEAVEAFKAAAKHLPNHAVLYNNMGIAYGKLGQYSDEIASLKKAVKIRPNYGAAHYNLGMTYLKQKNRAAAMKEYEALMKFDEGMAEALHKEIGKGS